MKKNTTKLPGTFVINEQGYSVYTTAAQPKSGAKPADKAKKEAGPKEVSADTTKIEKTVLGFMDKNKGIIENTEDFSMKENIPADQLEPVLKSLLVDEYVVLTVLERKLIELTDEGLSYAKNGSPEFQFVSQMKMGEKVDMGEMENRVGAQVAKIGFGKAMKQKWIKKDGDKFERIAASPVDEDQANLKRWLENPVYDDKDKKALDQYKKRKHLNVKSVKSYKVSKGPQFATERTKLETELTADMLRSGAWKD
jgi:phenylalanyl-tRNA synthetase alpha chain